MATRVMSIRASDEMCYQLKVLAAQKQKSITDLVVEGMTYILKMREQLSVEEVLEKFPAPPKRKGPCSEVATLRALVFNCDTEIAHQLKVIAAIERKTLGNLVTEGLEYALDAQK